MSCLCCFRCFEPDDPLRATTSRFFSGPAFICYKLLLTLYFVFWSFYWPLEEDISNAHKFVTYWTFYVGALYAVTSTLTAIKLRDAPLVSDGPVRGTHGGGGAQGLSSWERFLLGFQIFTWNVACVGSLVVAVVFWTSLYEGGPLSTTDINAHVLIAIIMAYDQLIVATEWKGSQMWASFTYGATYILFNILWYVNAPKKERVIYTTMDWGDLGQAILFAAIIIFVLVPVAGLIHYGVYRLRECLYESCHKTRSHRGDIEDGRVVAMGRR